MVDQHARNSPDTAACRLLNRLPSGRCTIWALALATGLVISSHLEANTRTAASAALADVQAVVSAAASGDTVVIPAGTATWTSTLQVTKNINLRGATKVVRTGETSFTVTDLTIIKDGETGGDKKTGSIIYCNFSGSDPHPPRITGITLDGSASTNGGGMMVYVEGDAHNVRIDNINFTNTPRKCIQTYGEIFGVMDHCSSSQGVGSAKFEFNHTTYAPVGDNNVYTNGDGSWIDGPKFGTSRAFFVEDCQFYSVPPEKHGSLDGQSGMRRVVRHCYISGTHVNLHGTETGGRTRSARMVETYQNTIDLRGYNITVTDHRGGTGLYWGNTYLSDSGAFRGYNLQAYRQTATFPQWGASNGANPLDNNDTEGNGTYVSGHSPHLYASGTITGSTFSNGLPVTVTVSGINGSTDWSGYALSDTTSGAVSYTSAAGNTAACAMITSNSGTTLNVETTLRTTTGSNSWLVGNSVVIYRLARASVDQAGMGKADLLSGTPPTNTSWPRQNTEPLYSWLNTQNGAPFNALFELPTLFPYPTIKENRDFFNQNPSFAPSTTSNSSLTTGVGYGTHANRPAHCTPGVDGPQPQSGTGNAPGVAYWETDTNTLYVCTAPDTWTQYYKPYVYPHPLVSEVPAAPTNLRVTN